jgi:hypothetical protein
MNFPQQQFLSLRRLGLQTGPLRLSERSPTASTTHIVLSSFGRKRRAFRQLLGQLSNVTLFEQPTAVSRLHRGQLASLMVLANALFAALENARDVTGHQKQVHKSSLGWVTQLPIGHLLPDSNTDGNN